MKLINRKYVYKINILPSYTQREELLEEKTPNFKKQLKR